MDYLTELAIKHKTDKWGKHNYTPVYYDLLKHRRDEIKKMLEIGIAEGAGVKMFKEFFPKAIIYGLENDHKRVVASDKWNRIDVFEGDQAKASDLDDLLYFTGNDLDIVIDDGSHVPAHQLFTANYLMPYLKKDCVYIIEDVSDESIANEIPNSRVLKVGDRYDDRLIIING
jgi:hypothetical protein